MAKYKNAPDLKAICEKIVRKYPSQFGDVATDRIHFMWNESPKESTKYAYVKKIGDEAKTLDPDHDFYFVVMRTMVMDFTPGQLHALCCHELKHIGPRDMDKDGNETVKLIKHDFEEFYSIMGAFGADWTFNPQCPDPLETDVSFSYMPMRETKPKDKEPHLKTAAKNA